MRHILIKVFPADRVDYISHYFLNFFFSIIFIINIPHLNNILFAENKPAYTLLVPKTEESFEENKDLIFSKLSINESIVSVKKIEKQYILEKINKRLDIDFIDKSLIPEAFQIITKKNKRLDIKKENKNIKEIIEGAEILESSIKEKKEIFKSFLFLFFLIIFFLIFLFILQKHQIGHIKLFLIKSRIYGAKDSNLIFNISIGYFVFQILGFLTSYFCIYILENIYMLPALYFFNNIEKIITFNLVQNIICIMTLYYILKNQLGKVM